MNTLNRLPKVLLVGGDDVDARLDLMHHLKEHFNVGAVGSSPALREKFQVAGFDYRDYQLSGQGRSNLFTELTAVSQLASIFRQAKPDIVHAFDTKPRVWGCLAARLAGVPIGIGTVCGLGLLYESKGWKKQLIWSIYRRLQTLACSVSDLTIFQNYEDGHHFVKSHIVSSEKTQVILGSGVSTNRFSRDGVTEQEKARLKAELGIQPGDLVVTMISRVIRSKGILEFMAAAQHIRAIHPHVHFLLIGPADSANMDRLSAEELSQLRQTVTWPGFRQDIPTILAISDIFAFPTAYGEGLPRVLLEAASMELPLVTTNSPGCNEVVKEGTNGYLIPIGDVTTLIHALLRLIKQPALCQRFGRASRQLVLERFDLSVVAAQTQSVYQYLLKENVSRYRNNWSHS